MNHNTTNNQYQYRYDYEQPVYREKAGVGKISTIVIGGAIIAIAGLGAYYIWSRNALVNEYVWWVKEYQREYEEFMENDGQIPMCDGLSSTECLGVTGCTWIDGECRSVLDLKADVLRVLEKELEKKGLIGQVIEAIYAAIGLVVAWGVYKIIKKIMEHYMKKNPPYGGPGGQDYYPDVYEPDPSWWPSENALHDHMNASHPVGSDPVALENAWVTVNDLPLWILEFFKDTVPEFAATWERGWENTPEWVHVVLITAIAVALAVLLALSLGTLAGILGPAITSCGATMVGA